MSANNTQNKNEKANAIIRMGAEIVGGMSAAAIGLLGSTPFAEIIIGGLGSSLSNIFVEITERQLSQRERIRIGATSSAVVTTIEEHISAGEEIRNDDFFGVNDNYRSHGEEIFEGVLIKAKNEHEERKLIYLGSIFANAAFMPKISVYEVNHILNTSSNLTYTQLCAISLIYRKKILGIELEEIDYGITENEKRLSYISALSISIRQEIYQLYQYGLIDMENTALLSWHDIIPNKLTLTPLGERYYEIMSLNKIPDDDLKILVRPLSPK